MHNFINYVQNDYSEISASYKCQLVIFDSNYNIQSKTCPFYNNYLRILRILMLSSHPFQISS